MNWDIFHDPVIIIRLVLQVFLFAGSALFSISETALFSLRETDLQRLEGQGHAKAARLRSLIEEPRQLIVSILCGNELINIAATVNLAGILLALFGDPQTAALANTAVMLPLLLIFGEITPKTIAVSQPIMVSTKLVEPVITPWVRFVMPLRETVRFFADRLTTLIVGQQRDHSNILSTDEFRTLLDDVEEDGIVNTFERGIILNLIEAGSTMVPEVMVPRPRIEFIDAEMPVADILERFRLLRHRRVPVFRGQRDNVLGMIREDTVMRLTSEKARGDITLDDLLSPAVMVPVTLTISHLADFFKEGDHHAVLVVNEFGGVEGFVTSDDVFGFLTEGQDMHVDLHAHIQKADDGAIRCAGLMPLRSLKRQTNLPLDEFPGISTVGGLIMALLNRVPNVGQSVENADHIFKVVSMEGLLIDEVLIVPSDHPSLTSDTVPSSQDEQDSDAEQVL